MTKSLGLPALSAGALSVLSDNCPLSDTTLHPLHGALSADPLVAEYCRAARADNTRRAYAADLAHFRHWGGHLPSTPDAVARYLAQHAATLKPVTLRRRLAALATAHRDHGAADPTKHTLVARVMQGIERKHGCPPNQVAPLLIEDLARIVARMGGSLLDLRDRAILLVGFFGALRRSELVALEVDDIQWMAEGIAITLRKSKTDQTRQGRAIRLAVRNDQLCPIAALRNWLDGAEIGDGAIFRRFDGLERPSGKPVSPRGVARMIKRNVKAVGLSSARFSGHSLRAGFATSAALAGFDATLIARQTGHRSLRTVATYVRP